VHDVTLFEYDALIAGKVVEEVGAGVCAIPAHDFRWLKARCLSMKKAWQWLTLTRRCGQEALRTANYAGIVRRRRSAAGRPAPGVGLPIELDDGTHVADPHRGHLPHHRGHAPGLRGGGLLVADLDRTDSLTFLLDPSHASVVLGLSPLGARR